MTTLTLIDLKEAIAKLQREIRITRNNEMTWCTNCHSISDSDFCEVCE